MVGVEPDALFGRVVSILEQAQSNVVRAVNTNMVHAYWLIGREIVRELQGGEERAEYGKQVMSGLSKQLTERFGQGFSVPNLQNFRKFFLAYSARTNPAEPIQYPMGTKSDARAIQYPTGRELTLPQKGRPVGDDSKQGFAPQLTWSHDRALMLCEFLALKLTNQNIYICI